MARRNSTLSTESFKAALRDKVSVASRDLTRYNSDQLKERAANRQVMKILIHPDEGTLEREDQYGAECARIALTLSQKLQSELRNAGLEVTLTRNSNDAVSVGETMQRITESDAQVLLVVSVGYNTTFKDLGGYRIFYMNESVDSNSLESHSFDASEVIPSELNYRPFQAHNRVLASSIQNSIFTALKRDPVGTNPVPHYMLRRAPMPGLAVVTGYLSNPADAQRLTDTAEQDAMAKSLAEGILNYRDQVSQGKASSTTAGGL